MTLSTKHVVSLLIAGALFIGVIIGGIWFRPESTQGSVNVTAEYTATSTAANAVYGATITSSRVIRTGQGTLGSVVITGANTGVVNFYNATTSNVNLRTGNTPTSTILLANLPASMVAGTYTFDVVFTAGLYVDLISGAMPTSTVTYR